MQRLKLKDYIFEYHHYPNNEVDSCIIKLSDYDTLELNYFKYIKQIAILLHRPNISDSIMDTSYIGSVPKIKISSESLSDLDFKLKNSMCVDGILRDKIKSFYKNLNYILAYFHSINLSIKN